MSEPVRESADKCKWCGMPAMWDVATPTAGLTRYTCQSVEKDGVWEQSTVCKHIVEHCPIPELRQLGEDELKIVRLVVQTLLENPEIGPVIEESLTG